MLPTGLVLGQTESSRPLFRPGGQPPFLVEAGGRVVTSEVSAVRRPIPAPSRRSCGGSPTPPGWNSGKGAVLVGVRKGAPIDAALPERLPGPPSTGWPRHRAGPALPNHPTTIAASASAPSASPSRPGVSITSVVSTRQVLIVTKASAVVEASRAAPHAEVIASHRSVRLTVHDRRISVDAFPRAPARRGLRGVRPPAGPFTCCG